MKENRFIELVNLYVDRQITADQTAELETEIQSSPRRRAVYRQYCQMHRATKVVYDSFQTQGDQPSLSADGNAITRFQHQQRHRRFRWAYYVGGMAAAACAALLLGRLRVDSAQPTAAGLMANLNASPKPVVVSVPAPAPGTNVASVSSSERRGLRNATPEVEYTTLTNGSRPEEPRVFATSPIEAPRSLPSLFSDGVFDSQQISPPNNQRIFRGRQTPVQQAEFTAFQFQR